MDKNKKEDIRQRVGGESILNNRCIDRWHPHKYMREPFFVRVRLHVFVRVRLHVFNGVRRQSSVFSRAESVDFYILSRNDVFYPSWGRDTSSISASTRKKNIVSALKIISYKIFRFGTDAFHSDVKEDSETLLSSALEKALSTRNITRVTISDILIRACYLLRTIYPKQAHLALPDLWLSFWKRMLHRHALAVWGRGCSRWMIQPRLCSEVEERVKALVAARASDANPGLLHKPGCCKTDSLQRAQPHAVPISPPLLRRGTYLHVFAWLR